MGFSEVGTADGYPVIFFHGFPSSRLEATFVDAMAQRQRLRVITPDRPGFGISTPQPNRTITDWPADVESLAAHLGLSRFAILGGSGGGPYALACAMALPRETMSAVGLLASAPPWEAGTRHVTRTRKVAHSFSTNWPVLMRVFCDMLVTTTRVAAYSPLGRALLNRVLHRKSEHAPDALKRTEEPPIDDRKLTINERDLSVDEKRDQVLRFLFEGFAQGSGAFVHEAMLLTHPWGINFENMAYDKIQIWHGTRDVNAPISMIRYLAARLPHAKLQEFDETHYSLMQHLEEIFGQLVPQEERQGHKNKE
jgi:pimeloyl-ACP methyl ester carboxylesterase